MRHQGSGRGASALGPVGQVCPSNREANPPKTGERQVRGVGIDKLSASFPLRSWDRDPSVWRSITVRQPGTVAAAERREASVPGSGWEVFVGVQEVPEHPAFRWWGKVEFNPSRVLDPEGWSLCPVEAMSTAVARASMVASTVVEPASSVQEWRPKRVDVARDFSEVSSAPHLVRSLAAHPRAWARRNFVHSDAHRNGAQTLTVGSGAGLARLYDLASAHGAPDGSLRAEFECRSRWLASYGGISTVGHITPERVDALVRDRWSWSALGAEVAGSARALAEAVSRLGLSVPVRQRFIGWLVEQAAGLGGDVGENTGWRYRALQKQHGIVAAPDLLDVQQAVWRRLDLETGRELLRVA